MRSRKKDGKKGLRGKQEKDEERRQNSLMARQCTPPACLSV